MLEARGLSKVYRPKKGAPVTALNNVSVSIAEKGLVFLLGKSGSGKSTLLNLLGGLDSYTSGEIIIKGKSSYNFSQSDFDSYRNTFIGFIFQEFNILEEYSVGKNIGLSLELQHKKADRESIDRILEQVDLAGYASRKPNELSGGQKQRVAIARALIKEPEIIMADEPTGALDSKTGKQVFDTLKKLAKEKLVVVVSHDRENAEIYGDRIIELADGVIISDRTRNETGEFVSNPINFLSDKLVQIKPGYELTQEDVGKINRMLKTASADTFISLDEKSNIEFSKKAATSGGAGFVPTTAKNNIVKTYDPKQFKLVRSRLPFKDSLKMGASGLGLKKVRLAFTIFLSFLAFTMFGISNTASAFDQYKTTLQTLHDNNYQMLTVKAQSGYYSVAGGANYYDETKLTNEQIDKLEELTGSPALRLISSQYMSGSRLNFSAHAKDSPTRSYVYYSNTTMNHLVEISKLEDGCLRPATPNSVLPTSFDQIALSDYHAEYFLAYGFKEYGKTTGESITSYDQLVGKKVLVSLPEKGMEDKSVALTISGIFHTDIDISDWESYKTATSDDAGMLAISLFSSLPDMFISMGYVAQGFRAEIPNMQGELGNNNYDGVVYLQNIVYMDYGGSYTSGISSIGLFNSSDSRVYEAKQTFYDGNSTVAPSTLNDGEIILRYSSLGLSREQDVEAEYDELLAENGGQPLKIRIDYDSYSKEFTLIGIIYNENNFFEAMMTSNDTNEIRSYTNKDSGSQQAQSINLARYGFGNFDSDDLRSSEESFSLFTTDALSNNMIYWGEGKSPRMLEEDEVIISGKFFEYYDYSKLNGEWVTFTIEEKKDMFDKMINEDKLGAEIGRIQNDWVNNAPEYYVIGGRQVRIAAVFLENYQSIVSEAIFNELKVLSEQPQMVVIKLTGDLAQDTAIFDYFRETIKIERNNAERLFFTTGLSYIFNLLDNILFLLKDVFFWLSIVFCVFAGMLLMNFIGVSISAKKKDIGVLRAIGARSIDVFNIFWSEGNIIGIINTALSIAALIVFSVLVNAQMGISIFVPGILQFGLMALLCFGVVLISTFIPVRKIASKKPIDAINNR